MKKNSLILIALLFLSSTSKAQNSNTDTQRWRVRTGGILTIPDGELRLDRGSRKVVRIDVEGGIGYLFGLEYLTGEKTGLEMSIAKSNMEYFDTETFATGEILQSSDQLKFTLISAALNYHILKNRRLDPYLTIMVGFASYGNEIQITTELPNSSLGPNPNPELVTFELHQGASIGFGAGLDFEITKSWMIGLKTQINLSNLEASIINDPEDDGRDIDLSVNPIIVSLNIAKSF